MRLSEAQEMMFGDPLLFIIIVILCYYYIIIIINYVYIWTQNFSVSLCLHFLI